jgi:uncharacterized membrane protein
MTDDQNNQEKGSEGAIVSTDMLKGEGGNVNLIYILYLLGAVVPVLPIVGLIVAMVVDDGAADWVKAHYRYQIRTFWIGVLYFFIGAILLIAVVGMLLIFAAYVWWIVRCIKGLMSANKGQAPANVETWLW